MSHQRFSYFVSPSHLTLVDNSCRDWHSLPFIKKKKRFGFHFFLLYHKDLEVLVKVYYVSYLDTIQLDKFIVCRCRNNEKQIVFSSENAEGNLEVYEEIEVEVPKEVVSLDLFTFHVH